MHLHLLLQLLLLRLVSGQPMKLQLARALTWMLAVDLGLDLLLEDLQLVVSRLDLQLDYMHLDLLFMEQQVIQQLASKLEGRL